MPRKKKKNILVVMQIINLFEVWQFEVIHADETNCQLWCHFWLKQNMENLVNIL